MDAIQITEDSPLWEDAIAMAASEGEVDSRNGRRQVTAFVKAVRLQGLSIVDVSAASVEGRLAASCLVVASPGRSAMVLFGIPGTRGSGGLHPDDARALLSASRDRTSGRGIHILQTLIAPYDTTKSLIFRDAGFEYVAELSYQEAAIGSVRGSETPPGVAPSCTFSTYSEANKGEFLRALDSSYVGSLDCPGLTGRRETADVMRGHQHTGVFDPTLWFLIREGERILGAMLLSQVVGRSAVEIVYVGLCPEGRGQGLGSAAMAKAFEEGRRRGARWLTVAVDQSNQPALGLYSRWGFAEIARRRAWVAFGTPGET